MCYHRLERGQPDLSQALLYQKLQMLNCCIERKSAREAREQSQTGSTDVSDAVAEPPTDDEDDDEFYDCNTDSNDSGAVEETEKGGRSEEPQGRLRKLDDLKLLHVDDDLYIPVTQDPAPMTEDTLAEHAEVLTRFSSYLTIV